MENTQKNNPENREKEVDLGVLLNLFGTIAKKIFSVFASFFRWISYLLMGLLIFIKKSLLWLLIGTLLGFSVGLYKYLTKGPTYTSSMIVRANFESSRDLYNKLDYYNSLIKEKRYGELASLFSIPEGNAASLIEFEGSAISDEMQSAAIYKNYLYSFRNSENSSVDSILLKSLKYEQFKQNLTKFDYPFQKITLYSSNPDIYKNVQAGILASFSNDQLAAPRKRATDSLYQEQINIIINSLKGIDTLRQSYSKRIASVPNEKGEPGNSNTVFVGEKPLKAGEIQLYGEETALRDALMNFRISQMNQQNILQVYSDFNKVGSRIPEVSQSFSQYPLRFLLATIVLLIFIELYRQVERFEKKKKAISK